MTVMTPIAEAITYLQPGKEMYLRHLVPTVKAVITHLNKICPTIESFQPLGRHLAATIAMITASIRISKVISIRWPLLSIHPQRIVVSPTVCLLLDYCPSSSHVPNHSFYSHNIFESYLATHKPRKSLEESFLSAFHSD